MKTVQMTLDTDLVAAVDKAAKRLRTTRSGFTRFALRGALERLRTEAKEKKQREGYERKPVQAHEFAAWEDEQVWPD